MTPEQWAAIQPGDMLEHVTNGKAFLVVRAGLLKGTWVLKGEGGHEFVAERPQDYRKGSGGLF